ncbi:DUF2787 family protein [Escherichia coli]
MQNPAGFHPVQWLIEDNEWYFDYVTDFSYMGRVYPELEKEMDFCWSGQYCFRLSDWGYFTGSREE